MSTSTISHRTPSLVALSHCESMVDDETSFGQASTSKRSRSLSVPEFFQVPVHRSRLPPIAVAIPPMLSLPDDNLKTPSTFKSEDSHYFVDLFGRLLALVPPVNDNLKSCPYCLKPDEDPFFGIFDETIAESSCCQMRAYIDLSQSFNEAFAPFGKQLQSVNGLYDVDLRARLSEHWRRNWITLGTEGLHRYLRRFVTHTDEDSVTWCFDECSVCSAPCRYVRKPPCCRTAICQTCWTSYVRTVADESYLALQLTGMYNLHCYYCSKLVPYSEALTATETKDLKKIRPPEQLMVGRRCPVCLKTAPPIQDSSLNGTEKKSNQLAVLKKLRRKKGGKAIACDRCGETFCGICGTNDHPKISCEKLISSDAGFQQWINQKSSVRPQFLNGRHCPSCHIPVTHSGGCPHMVCPCGVNFCYTCGQKHYKKNCYGFIPSHSGCSRMIPFISCPKLWKSQAKRITVHSLVSIGFLFGIAPMIVATLPITGPVVTAVYLIKRFKRRNRQLHRQNTG